MKQIAYIAVIVLALAGCSGYQLSGKTKSTLVDEIAPDTIQVTFCGNAYMTRKEVEKYVLQRASEAALAKGCSYFTIVNRQDHSEYCSLKPGAKGAPATSQGYYEHLEDTGFSRPNITITIRCFSNGNTWPQEGIDAGQFMRENFPGLRSDIMR